jgi:TPR repeat protein
MFRRKPRSHCFINTELACAPTPVRAFHWFQLAAASGAPGAKVNLGACYLDGVGVPKNPSFAKQLFIEAANKGFGLGATYIGLMEYFGTGTPVDKTGAEKWFVLGARLNDPMAGFNLAHLFVRGEGRSYDLRRVFELLRSSSKHGDVASKHSLGMLLLSHPDMAQSEHEARDLLEEASDAGNWRSSALLGIMARDGLTMTADPSRAYYYFSLARLQAGSTNRQLLEPDLKILKQKLSKEEQRSIEARADGWFQHHVPWVFVLDDSWSGQNSPLFTGTRENTPE